MIIDLILDRKDGSPYSPTNFRQRLAGYGETWPEMTVPILDAFQHGTEGTIKAALCRYVMENEYNPEICDYICSVSWTMPDQINLMCASCSLFGKWCPGTKNLTYSGCIYKQTKRTH